MRPNQEGWLNLENKGRKPSFVRKRRPAAGHRKDTNAAADSLKAVNKADPPSAADVGHSRHGDERARIVVPRQERGAVGGADLDIDLREVRYGAASKGAYLRVVPRQRQF